MNKIEVYDTTLRDGAQGESISFSLDEKIKICQRLDNIGIDFIEGGWPGSNPKDVAFFKEIKKKRLKNSKIIAFGSTRRAKNSAGKDKNLNALLSAKTEIVAIFGKSWDLHAREVLHISLEKNLKIIEDSIKYLKRNNCRVFFDAEHFFDG
ncbi:MAG: citramalate synthase, partial [Candidatus Omnitrophica bacterium]|nr:citramalate synthase [Candidatus Omnitrophota bacterium]